MAYAGTGNVLCDRACKIRTFERRIRNRCSPRPDLRRLVRLVIVPHSLRTPPWRPDFSWPVHPPGEDAADANILVEFVPAERGPIDAQTHCRELLVSRRRESAEVCRRKPDDTFVVKLDEDHTVFDPGPDRAGITTSKLFESMQLIAIFHVNGRGLTAFIREEEEPVWADPKDGRQTITLPK